MTIKNRLPHLSQIYPVYAIIVILVYGWTIYWALWKLPSWLFFLPPREIGAIFCYLMVTNLIESLLALFGVIITSFFLPRKWLREVFISRGSILAASVLILAMVFEYHFDKPADYYDKLPILLLMMFLIACIFTFLAGRIGFVRRTVETFAENAIIFLFISLPVSLLSLIVVVFRNLI